MNKKKSMYIYKKTKIWTFNILKIFFKKWIQITSFVVSQFLLNKWLKICYVFIFFVSLSNLTNPEK